MSRVPMPTRNNTKCPIWQIHDNPELGNREYKAYALLTDYLEKKGFKLTHKAVGLETAFMAEFSNGPGRRVGFCCEYDGLPG